MPIIRVTDDTTAEDLTEALTHLAGCPQSDGRTRRCDVLLDRLNEIRDGAASLR